MFESYYDIPYIVETLKLEPYEPEFKTQVVMKIMKLVDARLLERVQEELSEDQMKAFNDCASQADAEKYLESVLPMKQIFDEQFDEVLKLVNDSVNG